MTMVTDLAELSSHYDVLMKLYQSTSGSAADRVSALYSSAVSDNDTFLDRLLRDSLNPAVIRQQETAWVIVNVAGTNPEKGWTFLKDNYDTLDGRYKHHLFTFTRLISRVAANFKTTEKKEEVRSFLASKNFDAKTLEGILEVIDAQLTWEQNYGAEAASFFNQV
jgi:hypothetical protein